MAGGSGAELAIHARDLHNGFRPFGPEHFDANAGEQVDGWPIGFNAMEVVNSGAVQTDPLQLLGLGLALPAERIETGEVRS